MAVLQLGGLGISQIGQSRSPCLRGHGRTAAAPGRGTGRRDTAENSPRAGRGGQEERLHRLDYEGVGESEAEGHSQEVATEVYGYPPDKQEKATLTVLEQAELPCKEWVC